MPHDGDGQEPRLDSPPNQPEQSQVDTQPTQPVDTGAAADPTPAQAPSHPSEGESKGGDRARDSAGRFVSTDSTSAAPDPVQAAIDRLAKPAIPAKPDATKQPGKAQADQPTDAKAPGAKPTDEGLTSRTKDDLDASPEERARWKRDTAERFDRVLSAARTAREELEKAAPLIEQGKSYSKVLDEFELHQDIGFVPPEHFAGVVKAQAAINRALIAISQGRQPAPHDVETFTALASNVERLREQLGLPTTAAPTTAAPTTAHIKPLEGELPADLKDLVDVYGIDEKRVRLLAALEKSSAATPTTATAQPQPQQPVQPQAPAQPPQQRPVGVDMDQLYGRKLLSELHASGVQNPSEHMRVLLKHSQTKQEVIKRFPGTTIADVPQVFDSLDASTRYEILKAAHKALTTQNVPTRPQPPPPPTNNRGVPTTASPRRMAPDANGDPVAAAIALLARE